MLVQAYPFVRFHLRRALRANPAALVTLGLSVTALVVSGAVFVAQWRGALGAERAENEIRQAGRPAPPVSTDPANEARAALPLFNSAEFVAALDRITEATKLPVKEVAFTLDDTPSQPYMRYRITLTVSARYPSIRQFVDRFRGEMANVTLDAIVCARDAPGKPGLTCDLAFLAFYRKS
jgi:hypothetical protein